MGIGFLQKFFMFSILLVEKEQASVVSLDSQDPFHMYSMALILGDDCEDVHLSRVVLTDCPRACTSDKTTLSRS